MTVKHDLIGKFKLDVTENADKRFKTIVKNALKKNEDAFLIAVGCYAQLKPEEISSIKGVSLVLGNNEKFKLVEYLKKGNDKVNIYRKKLIFMETRTTLKKLMKLSDPLMCQ